ncbi:sugar transporter [Tabrizicola sp. KVB23]|uniref:Sugar transporter n=2 Tax=Fuscibacter oryzae TaxID=2803939 RepID=A0A8J7MT43_9RHOB|nr:sugar transporter [Fuscibacter oryzae]
MAGGFLACVALPTLMTGGYLYGVAQDQFASSAGFAVRSEETSTALGMLSGLSGLTSVSATVASDSNILYEYIQSQEMAQRIDARLNLRQLFTAPGDPVFGLDPAASVEGLTRFWQRVVTVDYDHSTGLIEVSAHAFTAAEAQAVVQAVIEESSAKINALTEVARTDATRYAKADLDQATTRLSAARVALTQFRSTSQIVDPSDDIRGQMGIVHTLEAQMAAAMVELNLVSATAQPSDPRVTNAQRRIEVIDQLIAQERARFGGEGDTYSTKLGEFERLGVEREFAERAYVAALTAYDNARAEAQRKSRYLATYVTPTLAETAEYPRRITLTGMVLGFSLLLWGIALLIYYSLRDRR